MPLEYTIRINTENAAFGETDEERRAEVARILRSYAKRLTEKGGPDAWVLRDANGNRVGRVDIVEWED